MLYLLDANTLITAKNLYFEIDRVPEYWAWLVFQGESGKIKIPIEVYEEFKDTKNTAGRKDRLAEWAEQAGVKSALLLEEEADPDLVARVTYGGYLPNPTDQDIQKMGRDPFLISYALRDIENRVVVTTEVSKPTRQGSNRHVPDVCKTFEIRCIDSFTLIRELDFSTDWDR